MSVASTNTAIGLLRSTVPARLSRMPRGSRRSPCDGRDPARVHRHQRADMRHDDRIVVDVDHTRVRRDRLRHLVDAGRDREPGPDVDDLADARLADEELNGPHEERPVGPHVFALPRDRRENAVAEDPVGRVVVLAAQPVVPDAGGVRFRTRHRCPS